MLKKKVIKIAKIIAILAIIAGGGVVSIKGIYSALEWETHLLPALGVDQAGGVSGVFRAGDRTINAEDRYYGLVVSSGATPLYYDSTSWRAISGGFPNMEFRAVWAQDYQNFWVAGQGVGGNKSLYHYYVNSGAWTPINLTDSFFDVAGAVNTDNGKTALFVVGDGVIIYKTDFSSFDFSTPSTYSLPGTKFNSVSAVFDDSDLNPINHKYLAWAAASNGSIYHFDGATGAWDELAYGIGDLKGITAVKGAAGEIKVWAVNTAGKIYLDGIDVRAPNPSNPALNSISGVYDSNKGLYKVWAVGNPNSNSLSLATIIHYDGSSWKIQNQGTPTGFTVVDVVAINPDHVWAFGRGSSSKSILTLSPGNVGGWGWMGADNCTNICVSNCETEPQRSCPDGVTKRDKPFGKVSLSCVDDGLCLQKEFNYGVNIDEGAIANGLAPLEGYAWAGSSDENQIDGVVEDGSVSEWSSGDFSQIQEGGDNKIRFNSGISQKLFSDLVHKQLDFKIKIPSGTTAWKFSVIIDTQKGAREIVYSSDYQNGVVINGEIYSNLADNNWHSIARDLEADLHKEEPNNSITKITGVKAEVLEVAGVPKPFLMDDIKLGPVPATSWLSFNRSDTSNPPVSFSGPNNSIAAYEPATGKFYGWARFLRLKEEYGGDASWVRLRGNSSNPNDNPSPPYDNSNGYVFSGCYGTRVDSDNSPLPAGCEDIKKCDNGDSCTSDDDCPGGEKCGSTCDFKICKGTKGAGTNYSCNQCGSWVPGQFCNNETGICTACSSCDLYGVSVDGRTGRISGYAWSGTPPEGFGWIDFSQAYYRGRLWLQTKFSDIYSETRIGSGRVVAPPSGSYNATYMLQCGQTNLNPGPENECTIINFRSYAADKVGPARADWEREMESTMSEVKFPDASSSYTSTIGKIDYGGLTTVARTEAGKDYNKYGQEVKEYSGSTNFNGLAPFALGGSGILGGKVYYIKNGNLTIASSYTIKNGSAVGESGAGLIVVDGDVIIENSGEFKYEVNPISNLKKLASLGFFIKGNLIINERVANLVGAYYVGGKVTVEGDASRPDLDPQFVNYGPMVAREFKFSRQYRGGISEVKPSEKIIYDGRVVANPPPGFDDLSKNLPIVREVMP